MEDNYKLLFLGFVILMMTGCCSSKIQEHKTNSISVVESIIGGNSNLRRIDSTVVYIDRNSLAYDSVVHYTYSIGNWIRSGCNAKEFSTKHLNEGKPYKDQLGLHEILEFNVAGEDFLRFRKFSVSETISSALVQYKFENTSDNILIGSQISYNQQEQRQLLYATFEGVDSLLSKVSFVFSNNEQELQIYTYNADRLKQIRREWRIGDSLYFAKQYDVQWNLQNGDI